MLCDAAVGARPASVYGPRVPASLALALVLVLVSPPPESAEPATSEPPPPSIEFREDASPEAPNPEDEGELVPFVMPEPASEPPAEDDPPEWMIEEQRLDDLPLAPTAARKSAVRRRNDVLMRPFRKPTYAVAAVARLGALVADNRDLIRPLGWGLAMQLRLHFVRIGKARFGLELHAGHTRWQRRDEFALVEGDVAKLSRISLLTHTDIAAGPALEIPLGPLFVQLGVAGGLAVSTLSRARSAESEDDLHVLRPAGLVRGGAALGLPIANNQGLVIGVAVQQPFSKREVLVDPQGPQDGATTLAFDTWVESFLGYQVWF